ncbi:astrotactin-2-like, partial [Corvus kubaryi]|uniref:astrotactin-2-like n=2 Tax=Corvus kubaryi TaxID=68294 RepID=UPI001C0458A1
MGSGDTVAQLFSNHSPSAGVAAPEVTQETVESLMQKFKESFRTNTPIEIGQLQPALRSTSVGRRKRRSRPRGGIGFGRAKGNSGSEADDETQLTFYTEQYRSRRRSKGTKGRCDYTLVSEERKWLSAFTVPMGGGVQYCPSLKDSHTSLWR